MKRTKRTRRIRLFLVNGLSLGALASCSPSSHVPISAENVYPNDYYVPGAGYYHAPFRSFYPLPYNKFDGQTHRYYYGGNWQPVPCESITNLSSPLAAVAASAEAARTDIVRGGFGCIGTSHSGYS